MALKGYRTSLVGELHDDIDDPWLAGEAECEHLPAYVRPVSPTGSPSARWSSGGGR